MEGFLMSWWLYGNRDNGLDRIMTLRKREKKKIIVYRLSEAVRIFYNFGWYGNIPTVESGWVLGVTSMYNSHFSYVQSTATALVSNPEGAWWSVPARSWRGLVFIYSSLIPLFIDKFFMPHFPFHISFNSTFLINVFIMCRVGSHRSIGSRYRQPNHLLLLH